MPELAAHLERVARELAREIINAHYKDWHAPAKVWEEKTAEIVAAALAACARTLTAKDVKLAIQQGNSRNAEGFVEFDYEDIAKALNAALRGRNGV